VAATAKALARQVLPDTPGTLYTVPAGTTAIVTNIALANITSTERTATITLDGVDLLTAVPVAGNSTIVVDLRQVLAAADVLAGSASVGSAIAVHVSGVEVS
jgi:hypothetical protein